MPRSPAETFARLGLRSISGFVLAGQLDAEFPGPGATPLRGPGAPRVRIVGVALHPGAPPFPHVPGPLAPSAEPTDGATDHDGDADAVDLVPHHVGRHAAIGLGVALGPWSCTTPRAGMRDGDLVALRVSEQSQGERDLNHDGDHDDWIADAFDVRMRTVACLALPMTDGRVGVDRGRLFLWLVEGVVGADRDGDGDLEDAVLHVVDRVR